ncbi:MAG TPA: hypothetical protein VFF31_31920 [Blastocatellia bacterium]|jgi:hypothetical protein|nr:hypothetical protein [Blastocatellia bacterium]
MAEYPKQYIEKLDAQCGKEAWPLIGLFILDLVVMAAAVCIVGELANNLL